VVGGLYGHGAVFSPFLRRGRVMRKFKNGDVVISLETIDVDWQQKGWKGKIDDSRHRHENYVYVKWVDERCKFRGTAFSIKKDTITHSVQHLFEEDI